MNDLTNQYLDVNIWMKRMVIVTVQLRKLAALSIAYQMKVPQQVERV